MNPQGRWPRVALLGATVAYGLLIVPATVGGLFAPMLADEGLSLGVYLQIAGAVTTPILLPTSIIVAWIAFHYGRLRRVSLALTLPVIGLALFLIGSAIHGALP
tara:strand:- start:104 stop:415 length:312 start_codon:yes stop_codon:yes gene_type:complete